MSQESTRTSESPSRRKCANCGLVNISRDEKCRRCGTLLTEDEQFDSLPQEPAPAEARKRRGLLQRVIWITGATLVILMIWYVSLLMSSDGLQPDQREKVNSAIALLQQAGFTREAFVLNRLTAFRTTDNWLNAYIGHRDAYAATNFPFEVVTLYQEFFEVPVDDRERAAVLLHEARHLLGDGEEAALDFTWHHKRRLGWTADRYSQTRVWDATERLTKARFPHMFQCGLEGKSDCY
jgi:hypothetical protein